MSRPNRRGFTLIELLVVIAIISILASMLFPTFAKARETARKASCTSNMKQMYYAITMYASDNDAYPQHDPSNPSCTYAVGGYTVPDWAITPKTSWAQAIYPYVKNYQVYTCPSNKGWAVGSNTAVKPISYIMNGFAVGRPEDSAPAPSDTCLLFDYRFLMSDARVDPAPTTAGPWVCFFWGWTAHDPRYVVLYQDGHVKTVDEQRFATDIWTLPPGNMFSY